MRIAVVGAGISGLSTTFYIKQARPDWSVTVFERSSHPGGTMRTENVEGFLFEAGSNGFLTNKPDTLDLVKASDGEHLLMRSNDAARVRYIYTDALHRLPESPGAFLTTRLLSLRGKLRTLGEVFVPPRREDGDETLQSFGYRRVGREFTDIFLNAMTAGIYASTPEEISVNAAFPAVVRLEREHGGLFRGMIKKRKKGAGPGGVLMSFTGGVSTFIEHLAEKADAEVRLGTAVSVLTRNENGSYLVGAADDTQTFDRVVLCTPAYTAAHIAEGIDHHMAMQLNTIEYSPIAVIGLGYRHLSHPLNGFGLLTTASSHKPILGVLWDSSVFTDRAPAGSKCVRVMIGGQRNPELAMKDEVELVEIALKGVRETMGVDTPPDATFVKRWERGIPNYKLRHLADVDAIFEKLQQHPGLYLNSNAYYGISLNDCVRNSRECAEQVVADTA